jgi:hypothetical protein
MGRKRAALTDDEIQAKEIVGRRLMQAERKAQALAYLRGLERKYAKLLRNEHKGRRRNGNS